MKNSNIEYFPKNNNLEWLRLLFAIQVVFAHAAEHLPTEFVIPNFIAHFPGVPAFFFVSGFLIYSSYLNAPGLRYYQNRFLRLFPGLLVVSIGGAVVILYAHGLSGVATNFKTYFIWFIGQLTIGQAFNPELFRDVGVGVINGSLWTITVEVLFYISVPMIVWMERRFRFAIFMLIGASFVIYAAGPYLLKETIYRNKTYFDIIGLTPLVWGWMFGLGILAQKYFFIINNWM